MARGCQLSLHLFRFVPFPAPWTKELAAIRDLCSAEVGAHFNSVLANWYRDGQDSMSMHADDEPELGPAPTIASVTLGEARPFVLSTKKQKCAMFKCWNTEAY